MSPLNSLCHQGNIIVLYILFKIILPLLLSIVVESGKKSNPLYGRYQGNSSQTIIQSRTILDLNVVNLQISISRDE